jgi:small conductance mechanosensitive channel
MDTNLKHTLVKQLKNLSATDYLLALSVFVCALIIAYLLKFIINKYLNVDAHFKFVLSKVVFFTCITLGTALFLHELGFHIAIIISILGTIGLMAGMGSQLHLEHLVSGVRILGDRDLKIGDNIKLKEIEGTIESKGIFFTIIKDKNDQIIKIPNATLIS